MKVVVMHDFFKDLYVKGISYESLMATTRCGGGSLNANHSFELGGHAASLVDGLSKLKLPVTYITRVDKQTELFLKEKLPFADLSHVKTDGHPGLSIVVEVEKEGRLINLMFDDLGSNGSFGPESLNDKDWQELENADIVAITNWSMNDKGISLIEKVSEYVKKCGGKVFIEAGDMFRRTTYETKNFLAAMKNSRIDYWAMNEPESKWAVYSLCSDKNESAKNIDISQLRYNSLEMLEKFLVSTDVIVHNSEYVSMHDLVVPTYNVTEKRVTGAGDTWNAGFLYGKLNNFDDQELLKFANACAGFLVCYEERPCLSDVKAFQKEKKLKELRPRQF